MQPGVCDGKGRVISRELKLEAVKLVRDRGVAVREAARDLDIHENVPRKWVGMWLPIRNKHFLVTSRLAPAKKFDH